MLKRKYNYVIFGSNWDLYKYAYSDVMNMDDVIYISQETINKNIIRRIHLSERVNSIIDFPLKSIWNHSIFKNTFSNNRPICFVFFSNWVKLSSKTNLICFLRKNYIGSKFVWFLQDLYKFNRYPTDEFDLVLSYDKEDCKNYGFKYHPTVYSSNIVLPKSVKHVNDIVFIGKAKDRLTQILRSYEELSKNGLKCDFLILDVPRHKQMYSDKITYLKKPISYKDCLYRLSKAKCILELMQKDAQGYTYRLWEAISFNKGLVTNNIKLKFDERFYSPNYISFIEDGRVSSNNIEFVRKYEEFNNPFKQKLNPVSLLNFIDNYIEAR